MNAFALALVLAAAEPVPAAGVETAVKPGTAASVGVEIHSAPVPRNLAGSTPAEVAAVLVPDLRTGTLIFSKGDCAAVKVFTASPYTHVAGVVMKDGKPHVYDSAGGVGTRCLPLEDWLETQRPDSIDVLQPRGTFSPERAARFVASLDGQLDRPYAVTHHLTGKRCEGLHCAEYMTDALCASKLITAKAPPRVSPASLREGLLKHELYEPAASYRLAALEPTPVKGNTWCSQLWIDTKDCTADCWAKLRRTCLCR